MAIFVANKTKEIMTIAKMRKKANELMCKHGVDMVSLPAKTGLRLGLEYVTLKGKTGIQGINFNEEYVTIPNEDVEEAYNAVRKELNEIHLEELTKEEVERLEKQIVMGSVYVADYENSFGVNPNEVSNYADGYLETKEDPEEYGEYDTFYDYIQSVEWIG